MKTCLSLLLLFTLVARGAAQPAALPPPKELPNVPPLAVAQADPAVEPAADTLSNATRPAAARPVQGSPGSVPLANQHWAAGSRDWNRVSYRTQGHRAQPLVVSANKLEPAAQAALEEDLTVMARLLEKEIEREQGQNSRDLAMGIVITPPMESAAPQAMYIEGYGALFTLNVHFPLVPPAAKKTEPKGPKGEDSDWERARRELFEPRSEYGVEPYPQSGVGLPGVTVEERVVGQDIQYDANKVESLKKTLLGALKNAANLRQVKADEAITVRVASGPASGYTLRRWTSSGGNANRFGVDASGGGSASVSITTTTTSGSANNAGVGTTTATTKEGRTGVKLRQVPGSPSDPNKLFVEEVRTAEAAARPAALTLRVKKADAESFAKGKLSLEEFQKKATISLY